MKVISTNIGQPREVQWRGNTVRTGIYKFPVDEPIMLGKEDVQNDHVIDRRFHGGVDKACYLYSLDHYDFWQGLYPDLNWTHGMFGENLTIAGLKETNINIDDVFRIGTAEVQVTQPRQPCFKLGIRFEDQGVLKQFIQQTYSGIYVRVLLNGEVRKGDQLQLIEKAENGISVAEVFSMLYSSDPLNEDLITKVQKTVSLPDNVKQHIEKMAIRKE